MNYWHIQMMDGLLNEDKLSTEEVREIIANKNIIGTGEWKDNKNDQCKNFKEAIEIGDIVLVRNGITPIALVQVIEKNTHNSIYQNEHKIKLLSLYTESLKPIVGIYDGQTQGTLTRVVNKETPTAKFIINWHSSVLKKKKMDSALNVLKYKKQIILQGPPGTGKTKLAKELANVLAVLNTDDLNEQNIIAALKGIHKIRTVAGNVEYEIVKIDEANKSIVLKKSTETEAATAFSKVIELYTHKRWQTSVANNDDRRAAAIAGYIFENRNTWQIGGAKDQIKIIQFHPSYSYEDFVRGITAESKGTQIEYTPKNKILADLAEEALKNYRDSKLNTKALSKEKWIEQEILLFAEKIQAEIEINGKYAINDTVSIFEVEEDAFRYKGNHWDMQNPHRMKFKDIALAYTGDANNRQDIKKIAGISGRAKEHASYDFKLLEKFRAFLSKRPDFKERDIKVEEKNYVLIIDEINRANLSSVLGELIYALEYRGEKVESMYAIDGDNTLILPPNLYIIGTMNTADRSVGHIDYAIRRRFAFVDVLPEDLSSSLGDGFHKTLFEKVATFFSHDTHLSAEFEAKDVQLGHSYFIHQKDEVPNIQMRLEYEIKPILREYVKDGVLIGENIKDEIEKLSI